MTNWRKFWYALIGPLMIWVVFIIVAPMLGAAAFMSFAALPPLADTIIKSSVAFCVLILAPIAALAEIAPPIVTKEEVNWRNRNADELFDGEFGWESASFLPPFLHRITSTTGKRKLKEESGDQSHRLENSTA